MYQASRNDKDSVDPIMGVVSLLERRLTGGNKIKLLGKTAPSATCPNPVQAAKESSGTGQTAGVLDGPTTSSGPTIVASPTDQAANGCDQTLIKRCNSAKLRRQLNAINSLDAIKLKMFIFLIGLMSALMLPTVQAGFFTFYLPTIFKPGGYNELTEMIHSIDDQINSIKDQFADIQYFWGQLRGLDNIKIENSYEEDSACSKIFPTFRELAIEYVYVDYEHYIKPFEAYREYLIGFGKEWYPAQKESEYQFGGNSESETTQ
jgi:hypothetical protein